MEMEINKKPAIIAKFKVRELVELEDTSIPEGDALKAGDGFDVPFMLRNEGWHAQWVGEGRSRNSAHRSLLTLKKEPTCSCHGKDE